MPVYPFRCERCGFEQELVRSIHAPLPRPIHCKKRMDWVPQPIPVKFARKVGKDTGFFDLDYGKRATEDLTVPGKLDRLQRDGRLKDPWRGTRPKPLDKKLVEETFGDATKEELRAHKRRTSGNRSEI